MLVVSTWYCSVARCDDNRRDGRTTNDLAQLLVTMTALRRDYGTPPRQVGTPHLNLASKGCSAGFSLWQTPPSAPPVPVWPHRPHRLYRWPSGPHRPHGPYRPHRMKSPHRAFLPDGKDRRPIGWEVGTRGAAIRSPHVMSLLFSFSFLYECVLVLVNADQVRNY